MEKRSLMAIYGHPDDEQGVSGLMAKYGSEGVDIALVCCTRGEAGEIAPGVSATMDTLGNVREEELKCAAEKIGIRNLYFLDYRDSGMKGTADNQHPRSLWQANLFEVAGALVRLIRRHRPQVILTFDPDGGYGHPDHIRAHEAATIAYFVAGDARAYPDHIREGLEPWSPSKLYWTAFLRSRWMKYAQAAEELGLEISVPMREFLRRCVVDDCVTTRIDVSDYVDLKLSALSCHASQMDPNAIWSKIPTELRREGLAVEALIRAESRVDPIEGPENDLFKGVE